MQIRILDASEKEDACNLVREVFRDEKQFGYQEEGIQSFLSFLNTRAKELTFYGAYDNQLEGVLAVYPSNDHLSLFFVRKEMQGKGIGKQLFDRLVQDAKSDHFSRLTVNAAPQAVSIYESLGFERCGQQEEKDGIQYIPYEYLLGQEWLGKKVTVCIDRPYGSFHPHYPDTQYECNYGYVEELIAGDEEFQDAYVYGVKEPLETFTGIVIAIIYRRDDNESKWIVAKDTSYDPEDVIQAVAFQEQYFETRFVWLKKN